MALPTPSPSPRPHFQYHPLNPTPPSFRLLRILPSRSTDNLLQLSLWHDVVSSASYRCLSYRWGKNTRCCEILVNRSVFYVGRNLYDFLEEVQSRGVNGNEAIWIDSICIDQQCVRERGEQVRRMGSIYTGAREVLVWLGKQSVVPDAQVNGGEEVVDEWDAIRHNPYWSRAWIVQEILLAERVTVVLSGRTIPWTTLGRAIAYSANIESLDTEDASKLWGFWHDRWKRISHREPMTLDWIRLQRNRESFWDLVHMHRNAMCADKRDRIYSLLGLVAGGHEFHVDYDESLPDLFWRAGEHFNAWDSPELVDILRVALFCDNVNKRTSYRGNVSPWPIIDSLKGKPDLHVRIPVRRASPTTSLTCRFTKRIKCKFGDCHDAPRLQCTRDDILLCTNARSDGPTEHGCIHGLAHPIDKPAAEPFEIKLVAHHRKARVTTTLPSNALQVRDIGTDKWVGVSTWSSLRKALDLRDLDRADRVKLCVPAKYAVWIWFGIHPRQLDGVGDEGHGELASACHALPPGTRVMKDEIEIPAM